MSKQPNILFLFSDQHSQQVAGCYGDKIVQTPNIDRLAEDGVRFTNAYCPSPVCVPSRMATLTARWPFRQECWTNDDMLRSDIPSWLHAAGAAGYQPTLIGRLHSIGPDQLHGYGERLVGDHSPNWQGAPRQSMGTLSGANDPTPESLVKVGRGYSAYQAKDECVTEAAVEWLTREAPALDQQGKPFCLTVGLMLPHPPYVVDNEAYNFYAGRVPPPTLARADTNGTFHDWWRENRGIDAVSTEQSNHARTAYWGLVHRMDEMIGRVLVALEQSGLMDNTLVVYASDHGDHLGERDLWWKHTFFDESVKVPLIMKWPGVLPSGETREQVVNLIDLSQTLVEVMGSEPLPNADGESFLSVARDCNAPWSDETYSEYCTDAVPDWTGGRAVQQRMLRSGKWKLCVYDTEAAQLFDLDNDPTEEHDLAGDPACVEILEALQKKICDNWAAQDIAQRMRARRTEKDVLLKWAQQVQPVGTHVWEFSPNTNRLDDM